jgi:hypothetical protein
MRHTKVGFSILLIFFCGLAFMWKGFAFGEAPLDLTKEQARSRILAGGFIATKPVFPLGLIIATEDPVINVSAGDRLFVRLEPREQAKIGDRLWIARLDKMIDHPITKTRVGQLVRIAGDVVVTGRRNDQLTVQVVKSYIAINPGDIVIPPFQVLPKNLPVRLTGKTEGFLIGTAEDAENLTSGEVIYIDRGRKHGVIVGDLFSIYQSAFEYTIGKPIERTDTVQSKLGEAIAAVVTEETTSAVITKSYLAIRVGDKIVSGRK